MSTNSGDSGEQALSFYERVIKPQQDADAYVAEIGGEPQITAAAEGLTAVIHSTRQEILEADFASRFLREPNSFLRQQLEAGSFTLQTRVAVEEEGERGLKRHQLLGRVAQVENEITSAISHLIELRADLALSQIEFEA